MKKNNIKYLFQIVSLLFVIGMSIGFTSCEDELEKEFYDPDKVTQADFAMLFTGALQPTELFRLEYGPGYHQSRACRWHHYPQHQWQY